MYDSHGNIIAALNNVGEWDNPSDDVGSSAEGMKSKKARELAAIRSGTVNDLDTVAPRELTDEETTDLREMLKTMLNIPDESYEEDASDLLDYAIDMINDGNSVGYVMNEVSLRFLPCFVLFQYMMS